MKSETIQKQRDSLLQKMSKETNISIEELDLLSHQLVHILSYESRSLHKS